MRHALIGCSMSCVICAVAMVAHADNDGGARVVHFPHDISLGECVLIDEQQDPYAFPARQWKEEPIPAQGDQTIPAGKAVHLLYFLQESERQLDLSPLDKLSSSDLNHIGIPFVRMTPAEIAHLKRHTSLRSVLLGPLSKVDDACLEPIGEMTWLIGLNVPETSVTDTGLAHVARLTSLQMLGLYGTRVTDQGMNHLTQLKQLRVLELGNTSVTDAGLAHLAGLTKLEQLRLTHTKINGAGLASLKTCQSLLFLDLCETAITDENLKFIKPFAALQRLDVSFTHVTNSSIPTIAELRNLTSLVLDGSEVSRAGAKQLKLALPKCRVSYGGEDILRDSTSNGE